jgi:hypothetical protein
MRVAQQRLTRMGHSAFSIEKVIGRVLGVSKETARELLTLAWED